MIIYYNFIEKIVLSCPNILRVGSLVGFCFTLFSTMKKTM